MKSLNLEINLGIKQKIFDWLESLQKRPDRFLIIDFRQGMTAVIHVESLPKGLRLLSYEAKRIVLTAQENDTVIVGWINSFIEKNDIDDRNVVLSLSDIDSLLIKDFAVPAMPREEILKAVKWQLKEEVPFDLEKASIDWQVAGEYTTEEGTKGQRILFIAVEGKIIQNYLSYIQKCQLNPIGITCGFLNYAHLLKNLAANPKVSAILDIGVSSSALSIYINNKLNFVRRLPISLEKLIRSLTKVLVSDRGVTQFSYEEAENIVNTLGIPEDQGQQVKENIQATHVMSLMRPLLEALVRELRFSVDYFTSNFEKERPSLLYITGIGSNLKNLDKYLNREFQIQVSYLSFPAHIDIRPVQIKGFGLEDQNRMIGAVVAGLEESHAINLLPLEMKTKRLERIQKTFLRVVMITISAIFAFLLFTTQFQIHHYASRIKHSQQHLATTKNIKVLKERVRVREDLISKIEKDKISMIGILKVISMLIPPEIILDTLNLDQQNYTLILGGTIFAQEGLAETVLADFMRQIEDSPFFTEASFISSQRTGATRQFQIRCDIAHG